ncbi:putative F-box domain-containing protein [Seiridium unicorne]|uniref:F-box domain-containing protein n=1 Tax=Seiridium unicorne TaxID=138068 RepID=A0ABR2V8L8_9PEZI
MQNGRSLASFATVSREWQTIIERHNFSRVKLTLGSRLANLGSMMHRNRALVRYVWFCVELQAYDCSECEPPLLDQDTWGISLEDNVRIVNGFEALFSTLSTWEPRPRGEMLQLYIIVYSQSDSEHWYKYLTFQPDLPSEDCAFSLMEQQSIPVRPGYDDHKHGWRAGCQVSLPGSTALDKIFDEIMDLGPFDNEAQDKEWWGQLPLAPAVTSVLLRQQTRRRWKPQALAWLLSRFPKLREFHYEPWREWSDVLQNITDRSFQELLKSLASSQPQL